MNSFICNNFNLLNSLLKVLRTSKMSITFGRNRIKSLNKLLIVLSYKGLVVVVILSYIILYTVVVSPYRGRTLYKDTEKCPNLKAKQFGFFFTYIIVLVYGTK